MHQYSYLYEIVKDVAKISTNKLSTFDFFTFISFHFVFYLYENMFFKQMRRSIVLGKENALEMGRVCAN